MTDRNTNPNAPDARLDDRVPLSDRLPDPPLHGDADFNARVEAAARTRLEGMEARFAETREADRAQAARDSAVQTLQALIAGNGGDTLEAAQFRGKVQDMVLAIYAGNEKPPAEFVAEAMKLNEARIQQVAAEGGDGAQELPGLTRPDDESDGRFTMGGFLGGLSSEIVRLGERFDPEAMTGSPEMEFASTLLQNPMAKRHFAALQAGAGPRSRVVPFPTAALRPENVFAETRTNVDTRREHTYRRDAMVPFFRPMNVLGALGVPMPIINNDLTLPRLTASQSGGWYAENADIADESITVGTQQTSPKRFGTRNQLSWMLLVSGDAQFGHQPLIVSEMARAQMQRKERQVYDKQGAAVANAPTGILRAPNVTITQLAADTMPTFVNILAMVTDVAMDNIPLDNPAFVLGVKARQDLSGIRRFMTGDASLFNDIAFRSGGDVPGIGNFGGNVGMMPGGMAFVTNHIPVFSGADSPIRASDTYIIFGGDWGYVWCIDYGTSFLTIDDVSLAVSGQTRITLNSYHDVAVRLPQAFSAIRYDAG